MPTTTRRLIDTPRPGLVVDELVDGHRIREWNRAARPIRTLDTRPRPAQRAAGSLAPGHVWIRNTTAAELAAGQILAYDPSDGVSFSLADNRDDWFSADPPTIKGIEPRAGDTGHWAVIVAGAQPGEIVKARIDGLIKVPITHHSQHHPFVDLEAGSHTLQSSMWGSGEILARGEDPDNAGEWHALIRLGQWLAPTFDCVTDAVVGAAGGDVSLYRNGVDTGETVTGVHYDWATAVSELPAGTQAKAAFDRISGRCRIVDHECV